jgi:NAD(P)H-hydrate epimerase
MWIANAEHLKEVDRRASTEFNLSPMVLMERAGLAVFESLREMLPDPGRITVLCGKGNNGGDAFVLARLARDAGYSVECLVAAAEGEMRDESRAAMLSARAHGVQPIFVDDARWSRKLEMLATRELIVDGLLGVSAAGEVRGHVRAAIEAVNRSGVPVLSIDVPSGIHCDTGEELGESVWALRTVTFGLPKPFLFEGTGIEHSGYWTVHDIGIPSALLHEPTFAQVLEPQMIANVLPERMRNCHKGDHGNVLIVGGSRRYRGAAILAARAALRAGAGLVTIAGVREVCDAVSIALPEAILLELPGQDGVVSPEAADVLRDVRKVHAAVFGPGLTHAPQVLDFLSDIWRDWEVPCVIDADALNAIGLGVRLPHTECILTPHPGEMSRLLQLSIAEIQHDRFRTVQAAVERFSQTVILKGPYSVVGSPGHPMQVNPTGNPGLAVGGAGDVLSGVLGTLLAQCLLPLDAASCGVYWHGSAADLCAQQIGPVGYMASEIADRLPAARTHIINSCSAPFSCSA